MTVALLSTMPDCPTTSDPSGFSARGDAYLAALAALVVEVNVAAAGIVAAAVSNGNLAAAAAASAARAVAVAGAVEWVSGTTYALGDSVWSPADFHTYLRIVAGAGATDPSADFTNWKCISADLTSAHIFAPALSTPSIAGGLSVDELSTDSLEADVVYGSRVSMGANDINLALGCVFTKTISGATTLTVSNVPALASSFAIIMTNPGVNVTWFSGVTWKGGVVPVFTVSGVDVVVFATIDGGATWRGAVYGRNFV